MSRPQNLEYALESIGREKDDPVLSRSVIFEVKSDYELLSEYCANAAILKVEKPIF